MKKGYTTLEQIENYLSKEVDSTFYTQIDSWIASMEKFIDNYTDRNFKADSVASARVYDGDNTDELLIDECIEVIKLEIGENNTNVTKYFTYPANASARGVPIHKIRMEDATFPCGLQNNRVTAKWGYSANVPDDIMFATTVFVSGILNDSLGGGEGEIKSESIGSYSVTYGGDSGSNSWADFERAKQILDQYKRINI